MPLSSLSPEDQKTAGKLWKRLFDDIIEGKVTESLNSDIKEFLNPSDSDLKAIRLRHFADAKGDDSLLRAAKSRPTNRAIVDRLNIAFEGTDYGATYGDEKRYAVGPRHVDLTDPIKSPIDKS